MYSRTVVVNQLSVWRLPTDQSHLLVVRDVSEKHPTISARQTLASLEVLEKPKIAHLEVGHSSDSFEPVLFQVLSNARHFYLRLLTLKGIVETNVNGGEGAHEVHSTIPAQIVKCST